jgi:hypothetical protein
MAAAATQLLTGDPGCRIVPCDEIGRRVFSTQFRVGRAAGRARQKAFEDQPRAAR